MRRSRSLAALLAAAILSAPAGAQIVAPRTYPPVPSANLFLPDSSLPSPPYWQDSRHLRHRIERARDAGLISRREARQLRRQVGLIATHAGSYGRDGLSASERAELELRARALASTIPPAPDSDD